MKTLNASEVNVVSGGLCEGLSASQCIDGIGEKVVAEVSSFVTSVYEMGGRLGRWIYDTTHNEQSMTLTSACCVVQRSIAELCDHII